MSAIFGFFYRDERPAERADLLRMDSALAACGPDGGGVWVDGCAALGQRLLAMTQQDSADRQPATTSDGRLCLVWDGLLDNRQDLLQALLMEGLEDEIPDSAIVLQAFQFWGKDCVQRLAGVFSFVIWNSAQRELFAARSPVSAPALMYYTSLKLFAFATAPRGLHALPGVTRKLNEERLAKHLTRAANEPDETFYKDIFLLPTGHWMVVGQQSSRIVNYWRPELGQTLQLNSDDEYWQAFRVILEKAVRSSLRCKTTPGAFLSGGLDSTAVAAQAARILDETGQRLVTFTEAPPEGYVGRLLKGRVADESELVKKVALCIPNIDINIVRSEGQIFLDTINPLLNFLEAPFRNTSNWGWYQSILSMANQSGLQTLLGGDLGNLSFSWDGKGLLAELLRQGQFRAAWTQADYIARVQNKPRWRVFARQGIEPILPAWLALAFSRLREPILTQMQASQAGMLIQPAFARQQGLDPRTIQNNLTQRIRQPGDARWFRYQMLAGQDTGIYISAFQCMFRVLLRAPLTDIRLVEFCLALPESTFHWNGETRRLARHALSGWLPEEVLARRERGLQAAYWYDNLFAARPRIKTELITLASNPFVKQYLNLGTLESLYENMPHPSSVEANQMQKYRFLFERGLMAGRYLLWFDQGWNG